MIDDVTDSAKRPVMDFSSEPVTDNPKIAPVRCLSKPATDDAKKQETLFSLLNSSVLTGDWRSPIRAMHQTVFDSAVTLNEVLTILEAKHHAEQEEEVIKWRKRIEQALSGDEKSAAIIALFGGPEKVLTPKPWTYKFNRNRFVSRGICWECGAGFVAINHATRVCSDACERQRNITSMRHWRWMQKKPDKPQTACKHCKATFIPARSDAVYCSAHCRITSHRLKRK